MTPSARAQATLELLASIEATPRPADAVISAYFRNRRFIGSKDRVAIAEGVYALLRHHARLTWWIEKSGEFPSVRARLIAELLLCRSWKSESITALFCGGTFGPMAMEENEKRLAEALEGHTLDHPDMPLLVAKECPAWAAEKLQATLGASFAKEMTALLVSAPLDLRINPIKATREKVLEQLQESGIKAAPCRLSPLGIRVEGRPAISALPIFQNGLIEIQDEGSQLVALLADAKAGQRVVDFCAGAGGKTLALAAMMNNKGKVVACDVLGGRLKRAAVRFRRAGLHNIETVELSGENDPWIKRHKGGYDRVLVDAPCGGSGTWRRNPDARWRPLGPGVEHLTALQPRILDGAARLVKAGGRLIYATCSLLRDENEDQIEAFLSRHPDFTIVPIATLWPALIGGESPCDGPYLRLTPAKHETDGFFAAIVEKSPASVAEE